MEMPIPNADILARKARVVARLQEVLPIDAVIHDERETRAYECDALTAYRCPPLVAVLPCASVFKKACPWCRAGQGRRWPEAHCPRQIA